MKERNAIIVMGWFIFCYLIQQYYLGIALFSIQKIGYILLVLLPNNLLLLRRSNLYPYTWICSWFIVTFIILECLKLLPDNRYTVSNHNIPCLVDMVFNFYFYVWALICTACIITYNFKNKTVA